MDTTFVITDLDLYIVGCRGEVQLGGLAQGSTGSVPLRLRLVSLMYWTLSIIASANSNIHIKY